MTHVSQMAGPIATSVFNRLCQYASSPATGPLLRRTCRFFPSGDLDHRQYSSLRLPTEGWPGWVGLSSLNEKGYNSLLWNKSRCLQTTFNGGCFDVRPRDETRHWTVFETKARFPLPELTGDRFPLPVNTGHVDRRAFPLAELTARVDG